MAQGIILAGGKSSRMKENKLLMPYKGKPIIEHVIETMKPFVSQIIIVSGKYHEALNNRLSSDSSLNIVFNEKYESGMFSSVQCGVRHVEDDFFLIPADIPLVTQSTYQALLNKQTTRSIIVPKYHHRLGHPIFIKQSLKVSLLETPNDSNLKHFRNQHTFDVVDVDDEGVLIDIDTLKDYQMLKTK